ncbi:MAG: primosomal protein N' [Terrimicrobiaceae bacterium]|nr:primosomal protein N' [Terrimicrobiaceae bacterium]
MSRFARVLLDQSARKPLDYRIPAELDSRLKPGSRVRVPLRTRVVLATVVAVLDESDARGVRDVAALLNDDALVRPALMRLALWMADYYCCPEEIALRAVLPVVIRKAELTHKQQLFVALARPPDEQERRELERRAPRQLDVIRRLERSGEPVELAELGGLRAAAKSLEKRGLVRIELERIARDPEGEYLPSQDLALNPEQAAALRVVCGAIDDPAGAKPILLHGVTGSGKTEVYLQGLRHALAAGKTALVLVPEISLTPQAVERFKSRFSGIQSRIAVLHSHLSEGERHDEWHKIHSGGARIVIGARSAIFAPLENLGLIVVDEEHENSYKQEDAPRYHARDVAVYRAAIENCAIVLGSATPSLESYHNAKTGKYRLLEMPSRIDDRTMPLIRVVDLRLQNRRKGQPQVLSAMLCAAIERRLAVGQQTILFLNRRGYSSALLCLACGHVAHCPNCSVALTYHRDDERIRCHLCGHSERAPKACPACRDPGIRQAGYGTQKVEEAVRKVFPAARVARMDADSMARKGGYRETLDRFQAHKIDILVGTQMIAKGLHFPNVTLVGIVNADIGLHMADFRAGERTFQLLTQVAGRAGRGETEGEVLVQTFTPAHPSIQHARHHDFAGFWEHESAFRRAFGHPPFQRFVLLTVRGVQAETALFTAQTLARRLREAAGDITVGEPAPAPLARVKGEHRFHLALRGPSAVRMSRMVKSALAKLTLPREVRVAVDVDALQLL